MSIEAIAAASAGAAGAGMLPPDTIQAGANASLADITSFQSSMTANAGGIGGVGGVGGADQLSPAIKAMFTQLEKVNGEARNVADYASQASMKGADMTPGEVVNLTMKCHEFMFHCQLTSNIANRTSDGVQQLFKQQS